MSTVQELIAILEYSQPYDKKDIELAFEHGRLAMLEQVTVALADNAKFYPHEGSVAPMLTLEELCKILKELV